MERSSSSSKFDVAILGGGMCGFSAALTLVRKGKKILLIERHPSLGWEVTSAFQCAFPKTDSPVARYLRKRINAISGIRADRLDIPVFEVLLDQIVEEEGIDLLLYSQPLELVEESGFATAVVIGSKSGEQVIRADAFVDATEEAVLWKQSNITWLETGTQSARQTVFFNSAEEGIEFPMFLGHSGEIRDISVQPSVREREVCVEFTMPGYSISSARLALSQVIPSIRDKVPQLSEASVTHSGFEPFPLDATAALEESSIKHPRLKNLFAAGIWAISDRTKREKANTIAGRMELGEKTGILVADTSVELSGTVPDLSDFPPSNPLYRKADVIVAGGGTAGALAAIAAGRQGAKVLLLEASTLLGGMITGGGVPSRGHGVPGGLQDELQSRVRELYPLFSGKYKMPLMHPEAGKVVREQMCQEAGVEVVYGTMAIGAEVSGGHIRDVMAATPTGRMVFRGEVVIDSTGDADVAIMAGAPYRIGREYDGVMHCYSQCGKLLFKDGSMRSTNYDSGYVDSFDVVDLTRARRAGIRQLYERFSCSSAGDMRSLAGEMQIAGLVCISPLIGFRQSRQIIGEYQKTFHEQVSATPFEDCIGYASAKYDCHSQDFENQQDEPVLWVWMLGNRERGIGGEIPYRCLLPKEIDGLLVACRSASTTNEANYQFRVIRNMYRIGEAAGIAAALCVRLGTTPKTLDVRLVQEELRKSGALGEDVHLGKPVPDYPLEELRKMLISDNPKDAVWTLAHGGEEEMAFLKDFVRTGPKDSRFWAAVALAWHRCAEALPELIKCVSERVTERNGFTPRSRNMVPLWQSSMVMLGRIGDRQAVPVLLDVLSDVTANMDALIAAIRALGRIGDAETVPALLDLLERQDLPCDRKFQITNFEGRWPEGEDGLWQIELAIAEILAGFGRPQNKVVEKYLGNPRTYVCRYAKKIAGIQ